MLDLKLMPIVRSIYTDVYNVELLQVVQVPHK